MREEEAEAETGEVRKGIGTGAKKTGKTAGRDTGGRDGGHAQFHQLHLYPQPQTKRRAKKKRPLGRRRRSSRRRRS